MKNKTKQNKDSGEKHQVAIESKQMFLHGSHEIQKSKYSDLTYEMSRNCKPKESQRMSRCIGLGTGAKLTVRTQGPGQPGNSNTSVMCPALSLLKSPTRTLLILHLHRGREPSVHRSPTNRGPHL